MIDGSTPAYIASETGHTETVALLLANKAYINAATKVQQFKIFKYLKVIGNELEGLTLLFFILSTNLAHENMNYYLKWFTLVFILQGGATPAYIASQNGHTETVALLLANKADINVASKVQQFKIFKYL